MLFDTHAHYDDAQFDRDRDRLLRSLNENGVELVVNPGSDISSSQNARDLADKYDFLYFAPGVHPQEADKVPNDYINILRDLANHPKCVAIGEIGFDYHYDVPDRETQERVFREQMEMAAELELPVIIHERDACADNLAVLREFPNVRGVQHCYSGSWETAKQLLAMGYYISFTGVVTFKNAKRVLETVREMPLDRLMLETDSPYLAPTPHRGERNSSLFLHYTAERIAELRGIDTETLINAASENGKRFFGIENG